MPDIDITGKIRCKDTIIELDPHPDSFASFDHSFTSPTYVAPMMEQIDNFISNGILRMP